MTEYAIDVRITPRAGLLDPQGKAIHGALHSLGFEEVDSVRVGRLIRLRIEAGSAEDARGRARAMCEKLLANPVTEDFAIELSEGAAPAAAGGAA